LIRVFAALLLPAAAYAQQEMPVGPIAVHKCVQTSEGVRCSRVQDGAGCSAANGYTRARQGNDTTWQQALTVQQGSEGPFKER
jgi:hypothetical protein